MHYFEEEYQRRFKDAENATGINPDELWEGIAQELEPEPKPAWRFIFWWWLIPVLVLGIAGVYWLWSAEGTTNTAPAADVPEVQARLDRDQTTNTKVPTLTNDSGQNTIVESSPKSPAVPPTKTIRIASENNQPTILKLVGEQASMTVSQQELSSLIVTQPPIENTTVITENDDRSIELNSAPERNTAGTSLLPITAFPPVSITAPEEVSMMVSTNVESVPTRRAVQVEVGSGIINWHDRFADDNNALVDANTLNEANRSRGGYQVGLLLRKKIANSWSVGTGLQYGQVYNTFDWTRSWDTLMYRDNIPGSDLINAEAVRRVKHQNELRWLQLPLLVGYEMGGQSWQFGLEGGFGLNYLLAQSGRTLQNETTVLTFSDADQGPYNQFFLNAQLQPYIGYRLNEQTQIRLQAGLYHQWHGRSEVYQLRHRSLLTNLRLGISIDL